MPRERMPMPLGPGLDRATGAVAVRPDTPFDARNLMARDAKLMLRPGRSDTGLPPLAAGTHILTLVPCRATLELLAVVYDDRTRELRILRCFPGGTGGWAEPSGPANGLWGILDADAEFPIVSAAEADGRVFFAHDEGSYLYRLPTVYYTGSFGNSVGPLQELTADLNGDGVSAPVAFRGVYTYLEYLWGWGYGTETFGEQDSAHTLRFAQPGAPTVFRPSNYFQCGQPRDPILAVIESEGILAVGKTTETYRIFGTSPADFGISVLDNQYGAVSNRSAIQVGRMALWWSQDGARLVRSSGLEPLAQPLELVGPPPPDFPVLGPTREVFATFDAERYLAEWWWPDSAAARAPVAGYSLSLWRMEDPRWLYTVCELPLCCGGELTQLDQPIVTSIGGYTSGVAAADVGIAGDRRFRRIEVSWVNEDNNGTELAQVWAKAPNEDWRIVGLVPALLTQAQSFVWTQALPLQTYELAVNLTKGGVTGDGYSGLPSQWISPNAPGSKTTETTTSAAITSITGRGLTSSATISWTTQQLGAPYTIERSPDGINWEPIAVGVTQTSYTYVYGPGDANQVRSFRVRAQRGTITGPQSDPIAIFLGLAVAAPVCRFIYPTGGGSPQIVSAYVGWQRGSTPGATADVIQVEYVFDDRSFPPATGWIAAGTTPAPPVALEDVGVQLFQPLAVQRFGFSPGTGGMFVRTRIGVFNGSSYEYGPWVVCLMKQIRNSFTDPNPFDGNSVTITLVSLTSTQLVVELNAVNVQVREWASILELQVGSQAYITTITGVNSVQTITIDIPPFWRGQSLALNGFTFVYISASGYRLITTPVLRSSSISTVIP